MKNLTRMILVSTLALFIGCQSKPAGDMAALPDTAAIDVRFIVNAADATSELLPFFTGDEELRVGPAHMFGLQEASASADERGFPAIAFKVTDDDTESFTQLTADHIGDRMAIVVDGQVISVATVQAPLPGSAIISGRFTPEYAGDIVSRLRGETAVVGD